MHTHKNTVSDKTEGSTHVAREVVAGALAVELAEAVADVAAGLVVRNELLGLEASGAGIAHVDTRHHAGGSSKNLCAQTVSIAPEGTHNLQSRTDKAVQCMPLRTCPDTALWQKHAQFFALSLPVPSRQTDSPGPADAALHR